MRHACHSGKPSADHRPAAASAILGHVTTPSPIPSPSTTTSPSTTPVLQALVFDFDGVVIDSERVEADLIIDAVAAWGSSVSYEDFAHLFGCVDADPEWDELLGSWCGKTTADLDLVIRGKARPLKDALPLMPGVRELMDLARSRGLRIGLATGNSLPNIERRLGRHGILDDFDAVVTRAEVSLGKPHPDIYLEVARRLGVDPRSCLVIEDSVPGCCAAIAAGMRVVACPSVVTAHCPFPDGVEVASSLLDVSL